MTSPFTQFANSTLTVLLDTGSVVTDPDTGNQYPVTETVEITACLKQDTPNSELLVGQDVAEVVVRGWLVNPMQFPGNVLLPFTCDAVISGVAGRLRIPLLIPSPYGSEEFTGKKIEGFFLKNG